jgi:uncharacterized protein
MDTGITVTGTGKASAPPDVMDIDLGAEVAAGGVQEALDGASKALDAMRQHLLESGVAAEDISTGDVQVWPSQDDRQRVVGYRATLRMSARLRDLGTAGGLVSRTIRAGGDAARVFGLALDHADPKSLTSQARDAAWADAQARAEQYARLAGRTLGPAVAVQEDGTPPPPRPLGARAFSLVAAESGADLPVEPGTASVSVSVRVRWELA